MWFALLMKCTHAAIEPIYGWTIDDSCEPWKNDLKTAFDGAAELTRVALENLDIVRWKRPEDFDGYDHWNDLDRILLLAFGFKSDPDIEHDSEIDPDWSDVYGISHHIL